MDGNCEICKSKNLLFNDNWLFAKTEIDFKVKDIHSQKIKWFEIEIPHDWLINDSTNLYQDGKGWYKKSFTIDEKRDNDFYLIFDGIYMDYIVYINGKKADEWKYGYSANNINISKFVHIGDNEVLVEVTHKSPNSRWYSGAGIFRNTWLKQVHKTHFTPDGIYITTDGEKGKVHVECELKNAYKKEVHGEVIIKILDTMGNELDTSREEYIIHGRSSDYSSQNLFIENPLLWSTKTPNLYTLEAYVFSDGKLVDKQSVRFGFRTFTFTTNEGFFENGEYTKLKGVCLHHDLGALGSAFNIEGAKRQLLTMKSMGVNAVRTAHNMPAKEFLDLCDEIGLLVVNEAFDMWERSKTTYDYARFFEDWYKRDVASWIKRDRNHPSLIMWSIGNEIYDTHFSERGQTVTQLLVDEVLKHDPYENGVCTIGSNFMQWENAQKCAEIVKFAGYNYAENLYDEHHEKNPHWIIYGSETASTVSSRGIYHFPANVPALTHDDMQCSSLGNSVVAWGALYEKAWQMDRDRKFCLGQFIWTGTDYIGEPTPYRSKNSYFGAVDTAGLPKDAYYFYQSVWTDKNENPMIHILPYWDFNDGEIVDVLIFSNWDRVELFLNGKSLGEQLIDHENGKTLHAKYQIPYEKGVLEARAYNDDGIMVAHDFRESFSDPVSLHAIANKTTLNASGRDLIYIEISAVDKNGVEVSNAVNRVKVEVSGAARLVGLDNGDSTDFDSYKGDNRRMFSGKLVAILQSTLRGGKINFTASSIGLEPVQMELSSKKCECNSDVGISVVNKSSRKSYPALKTEYTNEVPIRAIKLVCDNKELNKENNQAKVKFEILPKNATYHDLSVKVVKENGVLCNSAIAEIINNEVVVTAIGDGKFRLRVMANNGADHPRVLSELSFNATGLGMAVKEPYAFVSASFFDFSKTPQNFIANGALGGFEGKTAISFKSYDFGIGTDKIIISVGSCCQAPTPIEIWLGDSENGELIDTLYFPVNNGWDSFSPVEFKLSKKIKGIKDITFVIYEKIIFGGFEFIAINRAFEQNNVVDNFELYGDDYLINENKIEKIGNNVTISFGEMDFASGTSKIIINGRTPNEKNTIQLRYTNEDGTKTTQVLEFDNSSEYVEREFILDKITKKADINFVFLPGSNFDFSWFKFIQD